MDCVLHMVMPEGSNNATPAVTIYKGMAICEDCLTSIMANEDRPNSRRPVVHSAEEYMQLALQGKKFY